MLLPLQGAASLCSAAPGERQRRGSERRGGEGGSEGEGVGRRQGQRQSFVVAAAVIGWREARGE